MRAITVVVCTPSMLSLTVPCVCAVGSAAAVMQEKRKDEEFQAKVGALCPLDTVCDQYLCEPRPQLPFSMINCTASRHLFNGRVPI